MATADWILFGLFTVQALVGVGLIVAYWRLREQVVSIRRRHEKERDD